MLTLTVWTVELVAAVQFRAGRRVLFVTRQDEVIGRERLVKAAVVSAAQLVCYLITDS